MLLLIYPGRLHGRSPTSQMFLEVEGSQTKRGGNERNAFTSSAIFYMYLYALTGFLEEKNTTNWTIVINYRPIRQINNYTK